MFSTPPPRSPTFLGKIVARNKKLLQGIIGFGRAILADTPELKGASFAPVDRSIIVSLLTGCPLTKACGEHDVLWTDT